MGQYFLLNNSCSLVSGTNGGIVYDFKRNKIFHLLKTQNAILTELVNGVSIEECMASFDGNILTKFLDQLIKNSCGYFANDWFPQPFYREGLPSELTLVTQMAYHNCYIELPFQCDKNCQHCESLKINGCYCCIKAHNTVNKNLDFYKNIICDVISKKFTNIYFYGGSVLENWEFTQSVLVYVNRLKRNNQNVFIIINEDWITDETAEFMSAKEIIPIVTIDLSRYQEYDLNKKISRTLYIGDQLDWKVIFNLLISINNISDIDYVISRFDLYKKGSFMYSIILNSVNDKVRYYTDIKTYPGSTNNVSFMKSHHPCLTGTIAIDSSGKVHPCPRMTEDVLLDLNDPNAHGLDSLTYNIDELIKYWKVSAEKREPCNSCEYRYMCLDCRAVDKSISNDLYKKSTCNYMENISI